MPFFGFVPSETLLNSIQTGQQKKNSSEALYPLRDQTALLINDEIIDAILTELVRRFPPSDKRDTAEKLAGQGQYRVGESLDASLVTNLKTTFADIRAGGDTNKAVLIELYKQFAEATVRHFMNDFNKTLDLGMIKRKAADIGSAAVIKAVHIAIDKIFPHLTKEELIILAEYHDTLFHH